MKNPKQIIAKHLAESEEFRKNVNQTKYKFAVAIALKLTKSAHQD